MIDLIQQNPVVSIVLMMAPIIGVTWKVLDVLYVKPRDFRISVLEKNIEEIRKELQKTPRSAEVSSIEVPKLEGPPCNDSKEFVQKNIESLNQAPTLLNDMSKFYDAWKDECLTDLQRDHFEKSYVGQKVIWRARLGSVSEEKDGLLWVSLISEDEKNYRPHVIAVFGSKHKEALLLLNKDEKITVSGIINSFSLSPLIKDCTVARSV